ncbi:ROK family transcriptional regulator [Albidovulum sediminicola]|uniref:ROK family transcriptional regulator n=1 Tax=Albidovulum sediminicola TaxID=2984331 RepID=A0ABT2YXI9_9RHOB|nr:ROK family transcriptional regulator [Defluviimonas sp. WL0075]MCV2863589.1 ROK family transcriptional regulator [Defluviimonas sp. WL0075]
MDTTTIRDPMGGANQSGIRDHNERLVLSMIQRHGGLPSAEIARRTNLSAQTVSIIIRQLEKDGLLVRGEPIRGRVGKPSIPMTLRPDGALSVGLNIGRRSTDLVLIDLAGKIRAQIKRTYPYPSPDALTAFLSENFEKLLAGLKPAERRRVAGIGVAAPFELWNWLDVVNAPKEEMQRWRDFDVTAAVAEITGLPVTVRNDATAACTAEHVFGRGREFADYAYFFIGSFIGGGVVLNDTVYVGRTGNAGAFGSIPVASETGAQQLIHHASIYLLEARLEAAGFDPAAIWRPETDWSQFGQPLEDWIDHTARHLALAAVAVSSVIDFETILIDSNCPDSVRSQIVERTRKALTVIDTQGIDEPVIAEAAIGRNARAIGAASLPIIERYLLAQPLFG